MRFSRVLRGLGSLLRLFSFTLLIPLAGSLYWDEDVAMTGIPAPWGGEFKVTTVAFALTFLFILLLGFTLTAVAPATLEEIRDREGYFIVASAWLILSSLGGIPLLLTQTTADPVTAYFEAMSGLTTTGATALDLGRFDEIAPSVHLWRATLHLTGGLGIIVLAVAVFARLTEGAYRLMAAETPGGTVTRLKPKLTETAKALWIIYVGFNVALFLLLWPLIHFTGARLSWKEAALDALIHSMSTIATGGFSNHGDSVMFFASDAVTWVLVAFMFLSGVNFNLYWLALAGRPQRIFRDAEFRFYAGMVFAAGAVMAWSLWNANAGIGAAIEGGFFHAVSFMTTTGHTAADHNAFPELGKLILFLLMFTGAMVGSTAGGLKVLRIRLLFLLTRRELDKLLHPHAVASVKIEGRILPDDTIRRVVVFFFVYITTVLIGSLAFAFIGFDFLTSVSAAAALTGNVGPGFNAVAYTFDAVPPLGQVVGILLMWLGRLEIFTAVILFVPGTYRD